MRKLVLAFTGMILAASPGWAAPDHRAIALAGTDRQIIPGYEGFAAQARALEQSATAFCAAPDSAGLDAVRAGFHSAMDAWQKVQHIVYGPVEAFHRGQRVHFWPDKKNSGDRQMLALLKERKAEGLEPARMALASVAVQGLPALEMLLFGEGQADKLSAGGEDGAFRCRVVTAIAGNLGTIGAELVADWTKPDGFRAAIDNAGGPASPYADARQASAHLFNALHGQLLAIAEVKLAHPLGNAVEEARPGRAENWRARRSARNIAVNLDALRATFAESFVPALVAEGRAEAGKAFLASLDRAANLLREIPAPMEEAMANPAGWKQLSALKAETKAAARLLEAEVGPALGIQVGFNALDGD